MENSMSFGRAFAKGLNLVRLSLGGAMIGALASNIAGQYREIGSSMARDLICADFGFALAMYLLIDEDRKERHKKAEKSEKLDTPALPVENH
jgi:hypothetical protein